MTSLCLKCSSQVGPFAATFFLASTLEDSSALSFHPLPKRKPRAPGSSDLKGELRSCWPQTFALFLNMCRGDAESMS